MKKIALLLACAAGTLAANAQLSLSGTSYTQNFDNLGSGLPTGWAVYNSASATSLGTDLSSSFVATPGSTTVWSYTTGNYRNAASANVFANYAAGTTALQGTATDRALAVRQVSGTSTTFPGTDSGASFVLQIANTTGLTNFNLTFKLQSLDSTSARTTTWKVDYGFGSSPSSFTQAAPTGTLTTGGNSYTNNTVSVNFGSALNNNAGPVWIRIVTLNLTIGSGSRTTTGIDDYHLTWTGSGATSYRPVVTALSPVNNATGVTPGANLQITFDRGITANAAGNIRIKNVTDQTAPLVKSATSADVTISGKVVTIANAGLVAGKNYFVTFDSSAFDTAGYKSYGIYDTTTWHFATVPAVVTVTSINEGFDAACAASSLPAGWSKQNVVGPGQQWNCYTSTGGKVCMRINGFSGGNNANEDWLITPKINLGGASAALQFDVYKRFSGTELKALYSTNYSGNGDPNLAAWTDLAITMDPVDTGSWKTYTKGFSPVQPFFLAFKYVSTTADGYDMRLDSVIVNSSNGIVNTAKNNLDITVVGTATNNNIDLMFGLAHAGAYNLSVYDITGREVYHSRFNAQGGKQRMSVSGLNLTNGMYIIKMGNEDSYGVTKAIIQ